MANNLWLGALRMGLAANRPTAPDAPADTFGFYLASDTGELSFGVAGGEWLSLNGASSALLSALPTEDPEVAGELWNNNGVLTVSAGAP